MKKGIMYIINIMIAVVILFLVICLIKSNVQNKYNKAFSKELFDSIERIEYYPNDQGYVITDKQIIQEIYDIFSNTDVCLRMNSKILDGGFRIRIYTGDEEYSIGCTGVIIYAPDGKSYRMMSERDIAKEVRDIIMKEEYKK